MWYTVTGAVAVMIAAGAVGAHAALAHSGEAGRDVPAPVIHSVSTAPAVTPVTVTATEIGTSTRTATETETRTVTSNSTATETVTSSTTETVTTTETVPTTVTSTTTVTVPTTIVSTTTVTSVVPSTSGGGRRCSPNPC